MRDPFVIAHDSDRPTSVILEPDNLAFDHATDGGARQARASTGEPLPISRRLEWSLHARRRDFEHVLPREHIARVEARLDGARRAGAIVHGHFLPITPIDANVEHWPCSRTATPDLDQIEAK